MQDATHRTKKHESFDLVKVNRVREMVRRGEYAVDTVAVAESLLLEHLLAASLLDPVVGGVEDPPA